MPIPQLFLANLPQEMYEEIFAFLRPLQILTLKDELCQPLPTDPASHGLTIYEAAAVHFTSLKTLDLQFHSHHDFGDFNRTKSTAGESNVYLAPSISRRYFAAHDQEKIIEVNEFCGGSRGGKITAPNSPLSRLFKPKSFDSSIFCNNPSLYGTAIDFSGVETFNGSLETADLLKTDKPDSDRWLGGIRLLLPVGHLRSSPDPSEAAENARLCTEVERTILPNLVRVNEAGWDDPFSGDFSKVLRLSPRLTRFREISVDSGPYVPVVDPSNDFSRRRMLKNSNFRSCLASLRLVDNSVIEIVCYLFLDEGEERPANTEGLDGFDLIAGFATDCGTFRGKLRVIIADGCDYATAWAGERRKSNMINPSELRGVEGDPMWEAHQERLKRAMYDRVQSLVDTEDPNDVLIFEYAECDEDYLIVRKKAEGQTNNGGCVIC